MNFHSGAYQYNDIKVSFHTLPQKQFDIIRDQCSEETKNTHPTLLCNRGDINVTKSTIR